MSQLNKNYQGEIVQFLNFFTQKKDDILTDLDSDIQYFKSDHLTEQIYNLEDVENIIEKFEQDLKKTLNEGIIKVLRMCAIYIETVFIECQKNNTDFQIDMAFLESNQKINEMGELQNNFQKQEIEKKNVLMARLSNINGAQGMFNNDPSLLKQIDNLKADIEKLKKQNQLGIPEDKFDDLLKVCNEQEVQISELNNQKKGLEVENQKKLNESAQFQNLKKMISSKNDQITQLKQRLQKYENQVDDDDSLEKT